MKVTVSNVKSTTGREGYGFFCTVLIDGKPVAKVADYGDGGEPRWEPIKWTSRADMDAVLESKTAIETYAKTLPPQTFLDGDPLGMDADLLIVNLVDAELEARSWRRRCKTKTCFRLKGDPPEAYMVINTPFSPELKAKIVAKHGDRLLEIINERVS